MVLFLGHVSTHFGPGRTVTWYAVVLIALGLYLFILGRNAARSGQPPVAELTC